MSNETGIQSGETWRQRAGSGVLDPNDPRGNPLATPTDRRWLWQIENQLAVSATNDTLRQLAADLRWYLAETCEHHYLHYEGDEEFATYDQCLWCNEVVFKGDAANQAARVILGMEDGAA